ncbi:hypothetical protein [Lysobacter sp. 22409]|uniref:hypothetical protein n=1 Tax=Lysobacter sp. 22409 TaxID=3453917 RepID=UPI003F8423A8
MTPDSAASWKAKLEPLTGARRPIRYEHEFSADELARLREGLWPRDMDDRWVIWLDENTLRGWRSWTGTCIYEVDITVSEEGTGTTAVLDVLDAPDTYRRASTDAAELERFERMLSLVLRH